jgi:polysaccharide export outer membrane protein
MVLSSCVSKKDIVYFQNDTKTKITKSSNFTLSFKQHDLLMINVSALDLDAVKPFNLPVVSYNAVTNTVTGIPKQQSYLVDENGEINFPVLGKIKLEGLSRSQSVELITERLKKYINKPTVNIQISNFKIDVLGDVTRPGTFQVLNERITVLDALALAGDLNISGERIIEVKRESKEGVVTGVIDLKSNKLFNSPFFYLEQNDVLYVMPNKAKIQSASYNKNTGLYISVGSILISLIAVLTR